jgi:hypothetical protein
MRSHRNVWRETDGYRAASTRSARHGLTRIGRCGIGECKQLFGGQRRRWRREPDDADERAAGTHTRTDTDSDTVALAGAHTIADAHAADAACDDVCALVRGAG